MSALAALCADEKNTVYVLSSRKRDDLDEWLSERCPRLGLVAEIGYWLKRSPPPPPPSEHYESALSTLGSHHALHGLLGSESAVGDAESDGARTARPPSYAALADAADGGRVSAALDAAARALAGVDDGRSPPSTPGWHTPTVAPAGDRPSGAPERHHSRSATPPPRPDEWAARWEPVAKNVDLRWRDGVLPILESFAVLESIAGRRPARDILKPLFARPNRTRCP